MERLIFLLTGVWSPISAYGNSYKNGFQGEEKIISEIIGAADRIVNSLHIILNKHTKLRQLRRRTIYKIY